MGYTAMMTLKRYAYVLVFVRFDGSLLSKYYLAIVSTAVLYMQTY